MWARTTVCLDMELHFRNACKVGRLVRILKKEDVVAWQTATGTGRARTGNVQESY